MNSKRTTIFSLGTFTFVGIASLILIMPFLQTELAVQSSSNGSQYAVDGTDATFKSEVIESSLPVLVLFHAPWCQPCHEMLPQFDIVAQRVNGKFKFVLLNGDANEFCRQKYSIDRYPTLIFFNNGKELQRHIGLTNESQLGGLIKEITRDSQCPPRSNLESENGYQRQSNP